MNWALTWPAPPATSFTWPIDELFKTGKNLSGVAPWTEGTFKYGAWQNTAAAGDGGNMGPNPGEPYAAPADIELKKGEINEISITLGQIPDTCEDAGVDAGGDGGC